MVKETRTKKTLLNAKINSIFYFLTLIISFFSRKIFLDTLGAEFLGLTGTLQNLLGFLNLAESGVGLAIGYVLYKPLYNADRQAICEIVSVLGYLYRIVGGVILIGGVVLSFFLPFIFPSSNTGFNLVLVYFAFYAFLASSLIGYFINYRQNLLNADQKNYVVIGYFQATMICKTLIQLFLAYYTKSYFLWISIELIFGITYSFILNWRINKTYPWLKTDLKQGKLLLKKYPEIVKYTKQLFVQIISYAVQYQTVPFLIYAFVNLKIVTFYGNYTLITDKISQLLNKFLESTSASIGNLIAENDNKKVVSVFWELLSFRYFIGAVMSFSVYQLVNPFITLWLGKEYLLSNVVVLLIVVNLFIGFTRGGVMQFLHGYGLFSDVWAPIAEVIINLSVALILGSKFGLPGLLMGGITSQVLIIGIWKPYFLFSKGFNLSVFSYWVKICLYFFIILVPSIILTYIIDEYFLDCISFSFFTWVFYAMVICSLYALIEISLFYMLTGEMKSLLKRLKRVRS